MAIRDVLLKMKTIAKENGLSEPFLVGGVPRDKVIGINRKVNDIDLTTGDESIKKLAVLSADAFKVYPMQFDDGHFQLYIDGVKFDFSSNYKSPDVEYYLNKAGIKEPTDLQIELFSRDFTCNTLICPTSMRKIQDLTGLAIQDIKNKIVRTPLPPRVTLRDDPKRVFRAVYMAAKLGFDVEKDIITWTVNNREKIQEQVKNGYAKKVLAKSSRLDMNKTLSLIKDMDLWGTTFIPRALLEFGATRGAV
jgi:tRNA nucleotidyltransferase/poly(A) polymerase